jgi:hypothetical protein
MRNSLSRRWCAFRMVAEFLVAIAAVVFMAWVSYSMNWIRERRRILSDPDVLGWPLPLSANAVNIDSVRTAPGGLWLFGERGQVLIGCPSYWPREEQERARRLFPEVDSREIRQ